MTHNDRVFCRLSIKKLFVCLIIQITYMQGGKKQTSVLLGTFRYFCVLFWTSVPLNYKSLLFPLIYVVSKLLFYRSYNFDTPFFVEVVTSIAKFLSKL